MDQTLLKVLEVGGAPAAILIVLGVFIFKLLKLFMPILKKFHNVLDKNTKAVQVNQKVSNQVYKYLKLRNGSMERCVDKLSIKIDAFGLKVQKEKKN